MTAITPQQVQKLREMTAAGILDCKKALEEAGGDYDKATQILREKGKASASKKAGRSASEGLVSVVISADKKKGGIVELNCETDFVAKTKDFLGLVQKLAQTALEQNVKDAESLSQKTISGGNDTVENSIKETIGKLGENMKLKKAASYGASNIYLTSYIHGPMTDAPSCGKLGVLLEIESSADASVLEELGKEICMQIAAANPKWLKKEDVPADVIAAEKAIYTEQCKQMGKPEKAWPMIMEGKLNDYFKQLCLLQQAHVRDSSGKTSVESVVKAAADKVGTSIVVKSFLRYKVGEE